MLQFAVLHILYFGGRGGCAGLIEENYTGKNE